MELLLIILFWQHLLKLWKLQKYQTEISQTNKVNINIIQLFSITDKLNDKDNEIKNSNEFYKSNKNVL